MTNARALFKVRTRYGGIRLYSLMMLFSEIDVHKYGGFQFYNGIDVMSDEFRSVFLLLLMFMFVVCRIIYLSILS